MKYYTSEDNLSSKSKIIHFWSCRVLDLDVEITVINPEKIEVKAGWYNNYYYTKRTNIKSN